MKYDIKDILIGVIIGIISTTLVFLLIGNIDIQTDFQFGENLDVNNKDIKIIIEKSIDENNQEVILIDAVGKGTVTMKDIENELEKVFTENNIDASSGIEVNITLDKEFDVK